MRYVMWAVLLAVGLSGCATAPEERAAAAADEALRQELRHAAARFPESLQAAHRATVTIGRTENAYTVYVSARRPGDIRLAATGEAGGTALEAVRRGDAPARVLRRSGAMGEPWLIDALLRDAGALYLARPGADAALRQYADGRLALVEERPDGRWEFRFDPATRAMTECALWQGRRCVYRMRLLEARVFPGWPTPAPAVVEAVDARRGYRVELEVVMLRAAALEDRTFDGQP